MNKEEYLQIVRKQVHFIFDRDSIETELKDHLQDSMQDFLEEGLTAEEAEKQAVEQMGDPVEVGKLLNKEHHPLLGYLWITSKTILIFLVIPVLIMLGGFVYNAIHLVTPTTIDNSVETISVDIDLDIPTHKVKIDNICVNEEGEYYLTYRSWIKFDYSRAGWSSDLFYLKNSDGKYLSGGSYQSAAFVGTYGYKRFTWPEDDLLYLVSRDGETIEIDLKEYCNEKE